MFLLNSIKFPILISMQPNSANLLDYLNWKYLKFELYKVYDIGLPRYWVAKIMGCKDIGIRKSVSQLYSIRRDPNLNITGVKVTKLTQFRDKVGENCSDWVLNQSKHQQMEYLSPNHPYHHLRTEYRLVGKVGVETPPHPGEQHGAVGSQGI